jgi:hypothetical protein
MVRVLRRSSALGAPDAAPAWTRRAGRPQTRRKPALSGREDLALSFVHQARLDRVAIVVADQVQYAVA